ncbi:MAG: PSD1 and planctomycete cytochrome C domain-containing protein [Phycisphaerales bacterium]|nr:PSD1 and planctomycete cytochrome C domain-containing protein [Phycisphaerales bacterium]
MTRTLGWAGLAANILAAPLFGNDDLDIRYGRDIRPLLADRCFLCHGPDRAQRMADLRLDGFEFATELRDGHAAIVPGDPEASLLWQRISSDNPRKMMPPADSGKHALEPEELERIRLWIESGAEYEPHWAFSALNKPEIPGVSNPESCRNEIDRFVVRKLDEAGLEPNPTAAPETLVRRVYLDLTGLPPTPEEVDAYLADKDPKAYEHLIDRLLSTEPYRSRHAERMATPWLDLARYADTSGIHMDAGRSIWPWRDWVLEAYRQNMPYDRFVIEQLAGDILPDRSPDQLVATGFNRNHVTSDEGGAINEEYLLEYAVDRTNTVGTVFLGLSVGCARCHDHKFDPVSTEEFYGLLAFFNNNQEPGVYSQIPDANRALEPAFEVMSDEERSQLDELTKMLADLQARRDQPSPDEAERIADFRTELKNVDGWNWTMPTPENGTSTGGSTLELQADGSWLASGENPAKDSYVLQIATDQTDLRALLLEALPDPSLPNGRVGRAPNGNAVLSGFSAEVISREDPTQRRPLTINWAWADLEQPDGDFQVANAIRPDDGRVWAVSGHQKPGSRVAMFTTAEPFGYEGGSIVEVTLGFESPYAQHSFGKVRMQLGSPTETALARLPVANTSWYIVGPYPATTGAEAYDTKYGPEEAGPLAFGKKYGAYTWRYAPGVKEAENVRLAQGIGAEYVAREIHAPTARDLAVSLGSDDGIQVYLNGELIHEARVNRSVAPDQERVTVPLRAGANTLVCKIVNTGGVGGIYHRQDPPADQHSRELVAFTIPDELLREEARTAANSAWRMIHSSEYQVLTGEIKAVQQGYDKAVQGVSKTMVMQERTEMRPTYVYNRGLYSQPDMNRPVQRGVPSVLGALSTETTPTRIDLAEWIVGEENPLTARVTVNRFWELFFGRGLVITSDDFGLQGSWPTHPELLDWMAIEFKESGWDVQHMLRKIMTSATYRQSSEAHPEAMATDPGNRLLATYPRQRLGAEQLRDQVLYVSGLLVEKVGGPSVKPYQPEGLWREVAMPQSNTRIFERGYGDDLWRRSLYTYWKRAAPPPSMLALDAPTREYCATRRLTTNTPLQALVLWNDTQFVEAARNAAVKVLAEGGSERDSIVRLYRMCTSDQPDSSMARTMLRTLQAYRERYEASPEDAGKLLEVGDSPTPQEISPTELAAWTMLANALLASEPVIVKD